MINKVAPTEVFIYKNFRLRCLFSFFSNFKRSRLIFFFFEFQAAYFLNFKKQARLKFLFIKTSGFAAYLLNFKKLAYEKEKKEKKSNCFANSFFYFSPYWIFWESGRDVKKFNKVAWNSFFLNFKKPAFFSKVTS